MASCLVGTGYCTSITEVMGSDPVEVAWIFHVSITENCLTCPAQASLLYSINFYQWYDKSLRCNEYINFSGNDHHSYVWVLLKQKRKTWKKKEKKKQTWMEHKPWLLWYWWSTLPVELLGQLGDGLMWIHRKPI